MTAFICCLVINNFFQLLSMVQKYLEATSILRKPWKGVNDNSPCDKNNLKMVLMRRMPPHLNASTFQLLSSDETLFDDGHYIMFLQQLSQIINSSRHRRSNSKQRFHVIPISNSNKALGLSFIVETMETWRVIASKCLYCDINSPSRTKLNKYYRKRRLHRQFYYKWSKIFVVRRLFEQRQHG